MCDFSVGKGSIQNVYGATKILFNPQLDEANKIRERYNFEKDFD